MFQSCLVQGRNRWVDLARRIPGAKLEIYPDSGHGGVFQHHERFVRDVLAFLAD